MTTRATSGNPNIRPYTADDVVQQSLVAFGQATNYLRVNRDAAQYVVDVMRELNDRFKLPEKWETEAVQVLERVRAVGRLAAHYATQDGRTVVDGEDVSNAATRVRITSKSDYCATMGSTGGAAFPTSLT